jgi:protein-ribulosamine 3-kinase
MLPSEVRTAVEQALNSNLVDVQELGGGSISNAMRVATAQGDVACLKWLGQSGNAQAMFSAEAYALDALRAAGAVRVPRVRRISDARNERFAWLLLEWLEPGRIDSAHWEELGRALAQLHRVQEEQFGWPAPNFIGSLPQTNSPSSDWPSFWRDQRILPQAASLRTDERARVDALVRHTDELAAVGNQEGASLLHGDLWGGNIHGMADGSVSLIDPASYYGHREVDLAMAALFGGFSPRFYAAYEEAWPLEPGHEKRRALYQLYYLLVHVNLFGGSYVSGAMSLVGELGF